MKTTPPPPSIFEPSSRVMFVFAHQDDELPYSGLVQRSPPDSMFLWVTNGDGLADQAGMERVEYANARRLETTVAMRTLGIPRERLRFLGHSEVEIYRNFVRVEQEKRRSHEVLGFFRAIASQVEAEVRAFRPRTVFTLAWQGGNPEHDLVHVTARLAADAAGCDALYEMPEYELSWTMLLRFPPWKRGPIHEIRLTPGELDGKRRAMNCYPTQSGLLKTFARAMDVIGPVSSLDGGPSCFEDAMRRETFAPVPRGRDYSKSPHGLDRLEYIGDDYEGTPIRYSTMLAPVFGYLLARG